MTLWWTYDAVADVAGKCGVERLRRIARRRKNRAGPRVLILSYHQVENLDSDPRSLNVTPSRFAEHLEILQYYAHPIKLQQLSQGLVDGNLPDRSVVVTLDDGFANNLHNAKPLLERYDVPATVFLITGYIRHEREFWWSELERLFLQPGTLPEILCLVIDGNVYRWELGKAAHYSEEDYRRYLHWGNWRRALDSRHRLYLSLWKLLQTLTGNERQKVLNELLAWASVEPVYRPTHRPLLLEEVVDLAQGELIEVGAHTVTHPALAALATASQRDEILESKVQLEELLGRQVNGFAYPFGSLSTETVDIVKDVGYTYACSYLADVVGRSTDSYQLPRLSVGDWDGERFAKWLSRWQRGSW